MPPSARENASRSARDSLRPFRLPSADFRQTNQNFRAVFYGFFHSLACNCQTTLAAAVMSKSLCFCVFRCLWETLSGCMQEFLEKFDELAKIETENNSAKWLERIAFVFSDFDGFAAPHSIAASQTAWLFGMFVWLHHGFLSNRARVFSERLSTFRSGRFSAGQSFLPFFPTRLIFRSINCAARRFF